jgi:hypothetical protein
MGTKQKFKFKDVFCKRWFRILILTTAVTGVILGILAPATARCLVPPPRLELHN